MWEKGSEQRLFSQSECKFELCSVLTLIFISFGQVFLGDHGHTSLKLVSGKQLEHCIHMITSTTVRIT